MLKKKHLSIALMLLLSLFALGAVSNRVIPLDSPFYFYVDSLYMAEGKALAEGSRPWNGNLAKAILEAVSPSSDASRKLKEKAESYIMSYDEPFKVGGKFAAHVSLAFQSNNSYSKALEWRDNTLDDELLSYTPYLTLRDYFSGEMTLYLGLTPASGVVKNSTEDFEDDDRYEKNFSTNIPYLFSEGSIDLTMVNRANIVAGNRYVSVAMGRDKLSWGNGITGNLMLSDTVPYHDYFKLRATNGKSFSFDWTTIFFMHPKNYTNENQKYTFDGLSLFTGHRFEFRMLDDKLRVTFNESIMYQSESGNLDYRLLNPLLIMHGFYITAQANSLASLEVEFAIAKNWQIYGSFCIDDLAVFGEAKAPASGSTPNMYGLIFGVRNFASINSDLFVKSTAEISYVSPLAYHRVDYDETGDKKPTTNGVGYVDYMASVSYFSDDKIKIVRRYLGMPHGSDALCFELKNEFDYMGSLSLVSDFFFMIHGVTNEYSTVNLFSGSEEWSGGLLTENPFGGYLSSGALSYTFDYGISVKYSLNGNISFRGSLDFIYTHNFRNVADDNQFDIQYVFGLDCTL